MDQEKIFQHAFDHIMEKWGRCTLSTAICSFEACDVGSKDKFAVGLAILSMLQERDADFDSIEDGLTEQKMKGYRCIFI